MIFILAGMGMYRIELRLGHVQGKVFKSNWKAYYSIINRHGVYEWECFLNHKFSSYEKALEFINNHKKAVIAFGISGEENIIIETTKG